MLVLSRKVGEAIMVGDNVRVSIVSVRGEKIRVGIEAPLDVGVDREEIYNKKKEQREREGDHT